MYRFLVFFLMSHIPFKHVWAGDEINVTEFYQNLHNSEDNFGQSWDQLVESTKRTVLSSVIMDIVNEAEANRGTYLSFETLRSGVSMRFSQKTWNLGAILDSGSSVQLYLDVLSDLYDSFENQASKQLTVLWLMSQSKKGIQPLMERAHVYGRMLELVLTSSEIAETEAEAKAALSLKVRAAQLLLKMKRADKSDSLLDLDYRLFTEAGKFESLAENELKQLHRTGQPAGTQGSAIENVVQESRTRRRAGRTGTLRR